MATTIRLNDYFKYINIIADFYPHVAPVMEDIYLLNEEGQHQIFDFLTQPFNRVNAMVNDIEERDLINNIDSTSGEVRLASQRINDITSKIQIAWENFSKDMPSAIFGEAGLLMSGMAVKMGIYIYQFITSNWVGRCLTFLNIFIEFFMDRNIVANLMNKFLTNACTPRSSPQVAKGMLDGKHQAADAAGMAGFLNGIVAIAGSLAMGSIPNKSETETCLKRFATKMADITKISTGIKSMHHLFQTVIDFFASIVMYFLKLKYPNEIKAQMLGELGDQVIDWVEQVNHYTSPVLLPSFAYDQNMRNELYKVVDMGTDLMREIKDIKLTNSVITSTLNMNYSELMKTCKTVEATPILLPFRAEPICIWVCGGINTQKSYALGRIMEACATDHGIAKYNRIYSRNMDEAYWSLYNGQFATMIDDIGQSTNIAQVDAWAEFIYMKSNCPRQLNMADLKEKGKMFTSRMLCVTSNIKYPQPLSITTPEAIWRRRNIFVECKSNKDPTKEYIAPGDLSHITYILRDPMDPSAAGQPMSYQQFEMYCRRMTKAYIRKQEELRDEFETNRDRLKPLCTYPNVTLTELREALSNPDMFRSLYGDEINAITTVVDADLINLDTQHHVALPPDLEVETLSSIASESTYGADTESLIENLTFIEGFNLDMPGMQQAFGIDNNSASTKFDFHFRPEFMGESLSFISRVVFEQYKPTYHFDDMRQVMLIRNWFGFDLTDVHDRNEIRQLRRDGKYPPFNIHDEVSRHNRDANIMSRRTTGLGACHWILTDLWDLAGMDIFETSQMLELLFEGKFYEFFHKWLYAGLFENCTPYYAYTRLQARTFISYISMYCSPYDERLKIILSQVNRIQEYKIGPFTYKRDDKGFEEYTKWHTMNYETMYYLCHDNPILKRQCTPQMFLRMCQKEEMYSLQDKAFAIYMERLAAKHRLVFRDKVCYRKIPLITRFLYCTDRWDVEMDYFRALHFMIEYNTIVPYTISELGWDTTWDSRMTLWHCVIVGELETHAFHYDDCLIYVRTRGGNTMETRQLAMNKYLDPKNRSWRRTVLPNHMGRGRYEGWNQIDLAVGAFMGLAVGKVISDTISWKRLQKRLKMFRDKEANEWIQASDVGDNLQYLLPGDIIELDRGSYSHYGIYDNEHIIHFRGDGTELIAEVVRTPLIDERCPVRVNNMLWVARRFALPLRSRRDTVKIALSKVGHRYEYNLFNQNCEHFVTAMKYVKGFSIQAHCTNDLQDLRRTLDIATKHQVGKTQMNEDKGKRMLNRLVDGEIIVRQVHFSSSSESDSDTSSHPVTKGHRETKEQRRERRAKDKAEEDDFGMATAHHEDLRRVVAVILNGRKAQNPGMSIQMLSLEMSQALHNWIVKNPNLTLEEEVALTALKYDFTNIMFYEPSNADVSWILTHIFAQTDNKVNTKVLKSYFQQLKDMVSKFYTDHPYLARVFTALAVCASVATAYGAYTWLAGGEKPELLNDLEDLPIVGDEVEVQSNLLIEKIQDHSHKDLPDDGRRHKHAHTCEDCETRFTHSHVRHDEIFSAKRYRHICKECRAEANFNGEEQRYNAGEGRKAAGKRRDNRQTRIVTRQGQHQDFDGNATDLMENAIHRNIYSIHCGAARVNCLGIYGKLILMNYHFARRIETGYEVLLMGPNKKVQFEFVWDKDQLKRIGDKDLCMYQMPKNFQSSRDIRKKFVTEKTLQWFHSIDATYYGLNMANQVSQFTGIANSMEHFSRALTTRDEKGEIDVIYRQGWMMKAATADGYCGSPLVALGISQEGKIIGIHTAATKGSPNAVSVIITYEELMDICKQFPPQIDDCFHDDPMFKDKFVKTIDIQHQMEGNFTCEGKFDFKIPVPRHTKVRMTPLQPFFPHTPVTEPAVLYNWDTRLDSAIRGTDLLVKQVMKYGQVEKPFPKGDMKMAGDDVLQCFMHMTAQRKPFILTEAESINGIPFLDHFDGLNMTTSPGYPYAASRPQGQTGKAYLFDGDIGELYVADKQLRQRIDVRTNLMKQGKIPFSLWTNCLKDERRKLNKIAAGETRCFMMAPVDFTIVSRQYFLSFCATMIRNRCSFFSTVGINVDSNEWTQLYNRHRVVGDEGFDEDFKNFDGTEMSDVMFLVCDLINQWYDDGEENATVRRCLMEEMVHTRSMVGNVMYQKHRGMPSGTNLTAILNTVAHAVYTRISFLICMRKARRFDLISMEVYNKHVVCSMFGDDGIITATKFILKYFNRQAVARVYSDFGITCTDAEKTGVLRRTDNLQDLTFLKRKFVPHPVFPNVMLAPIVVHTIHELINWMTKTADVEEQLRMNVFDALRFAYHYGAKFFENFRQEVALSLRAASYSGPKWHLPIWEEYDERFLKEWFG